jgi:hypothetical protein
MPTQRAQVGDVVVVHGHHVGEPSRTGEILELVPGAEHDRYRVRWDDGHESIFTPGSDTLIRQPATRGRRARRTS